MKAFVLFAVAALIVIPANRAEGAVHTVGGALSNICYKSAQAGDGRALALDGCTRALEEESRRERTSRRHSSTAASC